MYSCRAVLGLVVLTVAAQTAQGKPAASAATGMKAGDWEITSSIESSDSSSKRTVTSRLCYRSDDVASPSRILPPQRGLGMKCREQDVRIKEPPKVTWKLVCKGSNGTFVGNGSMLPDATAYSAQTNLEQKSAGKIVRIDEKTSGRWVGECK